MAGFVSVSRPPQLLAGAEAQPVRKNIKISNRFMYPIRMKFTNEDILSIGEKVVTDDAPKIEGIDIEKYIKELSWSEGTPDIHKTLVAGNLRALYNKIAELKQDY